MTARLFVAIEVPEHVRDLVLDRRERMRAATRDVAWTRPEGWHVTLAFLGAVAAPSAQVLDAVGDGVGAWAVRGAGDRVSPPRLELTVPGSFRKGRVHHVEVAEHPRGWAGELAEHVQSAIAAAGLPVERRALHPHLTLLRTRGRGSVDAEAFAAAWGPSPGAAGTWEVDAVALMASTPGSGVARYETVGRIALDGRGRDA